MKKVLVTGATGFVGRRMLGDLVERGYDVHAVSRNAPTAPDPATSWHAADLFNGAQMRALVASVAPSHLLHLAWHTQHGEFWTAPQNFNWVAASLELLEAFRAAGGRRVVTAGTCAEYDWSAGNCSERDTPLRPASVYGVCKDALRALQEPFCARFGLSCAWGRVFQLYGPGEHPARLVPSVITALLQGREAHCTEGTQVRDFLYVEDAASAFAALLDSEVVGAVNIGSGRPVTIKDVVAAIAVQLHRPELVRLGAIPERPGEPPRLIAETLRLTEEVGWKPRQNLDDGLRHTIAWLRENIVRPRSG